MSRFPPVSASDLVRIAKFVAGAGHGDDVVHQLRRLGANEGVKPGRNADPAIRHSADDAGPEGLGGLGGGDLVPLGLDAGEGEKLSRHDVFERHEAGKVVGGGIDEVFVGKAHALDLLKRLSIGPRVAGGRQ